MLCFTFTTIKYYPHFTQLYDSRWVLPNQVNSVTFMGKEVFIIAHDIYIIFFNLKNQSELVYLANSQKNGDGVDAIAGRAKIIFAMNVDCCQSKFLSTFFTTQIFILLSVWFFK